MSIWIPGGLSNSEPPQPLEIVTWQDGTDEQIIAMLDAHYADKIDIHDYWSVGDTRTVSLSAMSATGVGESHAAQNVTFVLSNVGGKYLADGITECAFQVDQVTCLDTLGYMNSSATNVNGWNYCARRTWCNNVYKNAIPSTLRDIFKEFINQTSKGNGSSTIENTTDTFALRAEVEVFGSISYSAQGEGSQIDYYKTSSNRLKQYSSGSSYIEWWCRSPRVGYSDSFCDVKNADTKFIRAANSTLGIAPFGVI